MGWLSNLFGGDDTDDDESEATEPPETPKTPEEDRPVIDPPEACWATVLYPFPLDLDRAGLEEALASADISVDAIEAGQNGIFRVELPETALLIEQRDEPYPKDQMNRRLLPETFPDDYAYLSVEPQVSDPLEKRDMLRTPSEYPDPWADDSSVMRVLTRLIRQFLRMDGTAVVLNRSGGVAVPANEFLDVTERAADGDWNAILGWLDVTYDEDEEFLETRGFELFGLPDIAVHYREEEGNWGTRREWEALAYASATMIRENRVLGADEESDVFLGVEPIEGLEVPLGLDVAEPTLDPEEDRDTVPYTVELEDRRLVMRADDPGTVWETWKAAEEDGDITLPAYQALLRRACRETLGTPLDMRTIDDIPELEPFDCDIYQTERGAPVHFVSNGLGRHPRPVGDDGEPVHLELAIRAADPGEPLFDILANCAAGIALSDETWNPGDLLEFEEPLFNLQVFALSPLLTAEPDEGPPVEIWQLVPMTEEEFESLEDGDAGDWLEEHDGATGPEFAERWRAAIG